MESSCGVCPWEDASTATPSSSGGEDKQFKRINIAVASTSEDTSSLEPGSSSQEMEKGLDVRSRKNSTQLDSGSSSSDISLAIAEVSDRLRRTCGLAQQHTLDGDKTGKSRKLSTASCIEPRRSSVSIPSNNNNNKYSDRPSVSSFEDSGSCSLLVASDVSTNNPSEKDNNTGDCLGKTNSVSAPTAPIIISVSSVTDDTIIEPTDLDNETPSLPDLNKPEIELPLAPLAVPDSESPGSDWVPDIPQEPQRKPSIDPEETKQPIQALAEVENEAEKQEEDTKENITSTSDDKIETIEEEVITVAKSEGKDEKRGSKDEGVIITSNKSVTLINKGETKISSSNAKGVISKSKSGDRRDSNNARGRSNSNRGDKEGEMSGKEDTAAAEAKEEEGVANVDNKQIEICPWEDE